MENPNAVAEAIELFKQGQPETDEISDAQENNNEEIEENEAVSEEQDIESQQESEEEVLEDRPESYTVDTLAEAIGFETSELYASLKIPMADGAEPVPIGEFKDKFIDLGRENERLTAQATQMQSQIDNGVPAQASNQAMMQVQAYIAQINSEEAAIDWEDLESFDPAQAMLKRDKFRREREAATSAGQQIMQQQQAAGQQQALANIEKAKELIPEWKDAAVMTADHQAMKAHMVGVGFSEAEVAQMGDPRIAVLMKELIELKKEKTLASSAVNKVKKAPKVIGGSRGFGKVDSKKPMNDAVKRAKQTHNKNDELNAVKSILKSGMA